MKTKLFLVSLFLTVLVYAQIPQNGLIAQYNFDAGATLVDGINGQNFTQTHNSLTTITDRFGNANEAISLNGEILTRSDISINSRVSYSFWLKTSTNSTDQKTILDNGERAGTDHIYATTDLGHHIGLVNGKIVTIAKMNDFNAMFPARIFALGNTFIADDEWHHIVVRVDSYTFNGFLGRVIIYVDGIKDEEVVISGSSFFRIDTPGDITIGTNRNKTITSNYRYTDAIDDINIYNRDLTTQEIQDLLLDNNYCIPPNNSTISFQNITETTADVQITPNTSTYDIAYHKASEPFANAVIVNNITNGNLPISNLTSATLYKVYVRKHCTGNVSSWSVAKNLRTNGGVVYVNSAATGNNDGSSWSNGFTDLQMALTTVNDNSEIWIAAGTYKPHAIDKEVAFEINKADVKIYGGFAGTENHTWQRVIGANETILSGDLNNDDVNASDYPSNYTNSARNENSRHIITITDAGENLLLDGLTISDAHNSGDANERGGAIVKDKTVAKLTLKNCIIKDNVSRNDNAGLLAEFDLNNVAGNVGELQIENTQFIRNMSRWATGIYSFLRNDTHVNITIVNSLFDGNIAANINSSVAGLAGSAGWLRNLGNANSELAIKFINNTVVNNTDLGTNNSLNNTTRATLALSKGATAGNTTAAIENNIFWANKVAGGSAGKSITDLYENPLDNITVKNSIDEANFNDNSITSVIASSNANPLFTDLANADYSLTGGSPAIDTGDNTNVLGAVDLLGKQRVFNTTVDMGCYEYGAPTLSTENPTIEKPIVVYPNPVNEILYVKAKSIAAIRIYSILGKEIITTKQAQIPVSSLKPGIYIIAIETKTGNKQTNRFIKK